MAPYQEHRKCKQAGTQVRMDMAMGVRVTQAGTHACTHARGQNRPHLDVDLLVVGLGSYQRVEERSFYEQACIRKELIGYAGLLLATE